MKPRKSKRLCFALVGVLGIAGASTLWGESGQPVQNEQAADSRAVNPVERLDAKSLPNVVRLHPRVLSGGQPDGTAGFAELHELGVKTVVSVDGMKPDVETAKKYGIRYVHLPHSYDGIPKERVAELAKVLRDLPGPVYVHCHHGKHRSPAAAATGCVAAGLIPASVSRSILEFSGTSEHYEGLYDAAEAARPLDASLLDAMSADFPEVAELPAMAEAMVAIEHSHARMQAVAAAGWKVPPKHPDVEPAHEALLLRELYTELLRTDDVRDRPKPFRDSLRASEQAGIELEAALRANDPAKAKIALDRISANCTACHNDYRDVPLDEQN